MTPEEHTPPRRRSPRSPVSGRRPRPSSAAALVDDTFADLAQPIAEKPLPNLTPRRPRAASPRPPRTAPSPTAIVVARPRTPAAPPRPEPAVTPVIIVQGWAAPTRLGAWVPPALLRPWRLPAPLRALLAWLRRPRGLRTTAVLGVLTAIVCVIGLVVDVRSGMQVPSASADLVTALPAGAGASTLTIEDATALADPTVVPDAHAVAPVLAHNETVSAADRQSSVTMTGTTGEWLAVTGRHLLAGRVFSPTETSDGSKVAVLGSTTAKLLFPAGNAVGSTVGIAGRGFSVIGVLNPPAGGGADAGVLVPVTAAQGITDQAGAVDRILIDTDSPQSAFAAYQEADSLLLQTHHAATPFSADFALSLPANPPVSRLAVAALALGAAVALLLASVAIRSLRRLV